MPDNRSLWSDGPSEDDHHGWLDAEPDAPAAPTGPPLSSKQDDTQVHRTGRLTPPAGRPPRDGPSPWQRARRALIWPLVALCVVALVVSGIAIGTQLVDQKTVERTVVAGSGNGGSTASQVKAAYEAAHEGVVFIKTNEASGSGWVYDDKGTIVTNNHVVAGASSVRVRFKDDGKQIPARVLGTDVSSDLAVLRIDPKEADKLVPLKIAESDDVQTGDPVVAIGYPFGLDQTTTAGIISGVGRQIPAQTNFQIDKVLQTDAPINPGNSGGPLLNVKGEVVGVNSQIATASGGGGSVGIGFAIPSDTIRDVVPQLEAGKSVQYAYLGVSVGDVNKGSGALVAEVRPGSPAQQAKLQANSLAAQNGVADPDGDVIVKIDGTDVQQSSDVTRTINAHKPGDKIELEVRRGGDTRKVQVTLGDRPASSTPTTATPTTPSSPSTPSDPTNPLNPQTPSIP
ncbi:trypsin-like peptidase domain-containing protein [Patulibacter sp. NPDC049589]|uniref:S1C family serine protease n=1 Tax=Patulibacter sp. NPDC049589 TaxID=3154731 RepID=UPI003420FB61